MATLCSYENALQRVRQAVDVPWLDSLARKASYMLGQEWGGYRSSDLGSEYWPYYPDVQVRRYKVGMGRDILNTAYLSLSRLMSADPMPAYSGIDAMTAEARAQFWLARYKHGGRTGNGFSSGIGSCFMDFDNLGVGFVRVGIEKGKPHEGLATERATVRYSPIHDTVFDASVRDPGEANHAAWREFWPVDLAVDKFGTKVKGKAGVNPEALVKGFVKQRAEWNTDQPHEVVEVVEYWQLERGKEAPTKVCLIGGIGGEAEYYAEEHDMDLLPLVGFMNVHPPKVHRPMGRIDLMTGTQEQKNQLRGYLRLVLANPPVDLIDPYGVDEDDVRAWRRGDETHVKTTKPMTKDRVYWDRKPGMDAPSTLFQFDQDLDRQLNEDGGTSEIDRGNVLSEQRTLGEVQQVQAASQMNRAWAAKQAAIGFSRVVKVFEEVARRWDTEPAQIDVFGTKVNVNDPMKPESGADQLYFEPAEATIDSQSLTPQDDAVKGARRRAELDAFAPYVGTLVKPEWFIRERLKTIGVKDPEEAMMQPDPLQGAVQQLVGQQGQDAAMAGAGPSTV